MALILAASSPGKRGIIVLTHKEMQTLRKLKEEVPSSRQIVGAALQDLKTRYVLGVHFGWRITRRTQWLHGVQFALAPRAILPSRFKPLHVKRIPWSSAHFISDDFTQERTKAARDVICVSTNSPYKGLDTLVPVWKQLAIRNTGLRATLISKRHPSLIHADREDRLESEFPARHGEGLGSLELWRPDTSQRLKGFASKQIADLLLESTSGVLFSRGEGHSKFLSEMLLAGTRPVIYDSMSYAGGKRNLKELGVMFMNTGTEIATIEKAIEEGPLSEEQRLKSYVRYSQAVNEPRMRACLSDAFKQDFLWIDGIDLKLALPAHDMRWSPWLEHDDERTTSDIQSIDDFLRFLDWTEEHD